MSATSNWRNVESPRGGNSMRGGNRAKPAFTAPRRKMEHIASVSRSSGLEKDGDALKNFDVQDEYRAFIQGKLDDIWAKYPRNSTESEAQTRQRIDAQENVLILFRKLREGILSSQRADQFTLEVYETSLYLGVLFDSPRHISPVIPALMSYIRLPSTKLDRNYIDPVLVCLLHQLVAAYPSQREFHASLASVPKAFFGDGSPARVWITSLAGCIRTHNYAKIDNLTQTAALPTADTAPSSALLQNRELPRKALYHLIASLRSRTREMAWTILRSAYRELSCQVDPQLNTRPWLDRSLGLRSDLPGQCSIGLDEWLERESGLGHVRRKDGVEGRWIVCKPR
ncbi:Pre-mrna-splicing factor cwc22 [Mycena sanguinolenta]|uniref:Pre-mrna-splicing factor cwc22 n=1 Tax=Mycena sanguinolenta TaxID=230812 RepID=A0A8H6XXZ1_9AGAR|nr:Pre-mrna-splicing factor cwc22 [Mycena sanguinolenta]